MATKITSGSIFSAGAVIVGVDADAPSATPSAPAPESSVSWVVVGTYGDDDGGVSSGSVYVYDATDLTSQPTKLLPPDIAAYDFFGYHVAASDNMIVVGSLNDDDGGANTGSAYVYDANDLTSAPTKLTAFDAVSGDKFGEYVAVSDNKVVIGVQRANSYAGSVYVYDANNLTAQPAKLTAFDAAASDYFGVSIALNDSHIVVGASNSDNGRKGDGSIYVYDATDLTAAPTKLSGAPNSNGNFGWSVDINDTHIVVGAKGGGIGGTAFVYDLSDLSATPTELIRPDAWHGDFFGWSVSLSDDYAFVGAFKDDDDGTSSGSVFAYQLSNLSAAPTKLTAPDAAAGDQLGRSVSAMFDQVVIGASSNDDPTDSGSAYVYDVNDLTAAPTKLTAFDAAEGDNLGYSVAIG